MGSETVYVTGLYDVVQYDTSGRILTTFTLPAADNFASGLAVDLVGNLYVGNGKSGVERIEKFAPDGTYLGVFTDQVHTPIDLQFMANGDLLAVDFWEGAVVRLSGSGEVIGSFATGLKSPFGLEMDLAGNVLVTSANEESGLAEFRRYRPDGQLLGVTETAGTGGSNYLAVGQDGDVFVNTRDLVDRFSAAGDRLGEYLSYGDFSHLGAGIDFDSNGRMYIATIGGPTFRFNADGTYDGVFAETAGWNVLVHNSVPEPQSLISVAAGALVIFARRRAK
ncbi:MAG: PEP-CTERM sorting domain-containing protein [Planctomycetales bacterium]|nr:PEP-CTERM sorting domain-containing protein [Planctomycetales bacterium]